MSPNHLPNPSTPSLLPGTCVPATAGTHAELLVQIYTLSADAERPPSRSLAHTEAQYEISNHREIYGARKRNSACSSGGCSSGGGPQSALFWRRVRRALAPRRFAATRGDSSSGAGLSQNGTCSGGGIGRKIRAGRSTVNYFRFGPESV